MRRRAGQVQLSLPISSGRGGARDGAGRPPVAGCRSPVPHRKDARSGAVPSPPHVASGWDDFLRYEVLESSRRFWRRSGRAAKARFRVLAFSVQTDHIHTIVEADGNRAMDAGARGLAIRVALAVNRALNRKGSVWGDRYHARQLRTPRETRAALLYVLQNWKKHLGNVTGIDGCSSARWFEGWASPPALPTKPIPVARPRTWLASTGWREHGGGLLGFEEAPANSGRLKRAIVR